MRAHASRWASFHRPVSWGLIRPSAVTAVASVRSRPKPPCARAPRFTRCQSVGTPSRRSTEYWHIGASQIRLRTVSPRRVTGSKSALTQGSTEARRRAFRTAASGPSHQQRLAEEREHPVHGLLLPVRGEGGVLAPGQLHADERVADLAAEGVEPGADGDVVPE